MIRHLLRLGWNRKGSYVLLGAEIAVCFLIVAAIATSALFYWQNYRLPLGFQYRDVWSVIVDPPGNRTYDDPWSAVDSLTVQSIYRTLRDMEEAVAVAECTSPPFLGWTSNSSAELNGRPSVTYFISRGSDDLDQVLDLEIVAGRWFAPGDDLGEADPVLVNKRLAEYVFGETDPVGREIDVKRGETQRFKVVGVVSDHRYRGPLEEPYYFVFFWSRLDRPVGVANGHLPESFLIRLRPGTPRRFEKELHQRLQEVAPGWTARVEVLEERYALHLRDKMREYIFYGIIAGFLLLMVLLGLTGVLWQSVSQRTQETGLRRAAGATKGQIQGQFVGEVLVVATGAICLGTALVVQVGLLDLFPHLTSGVYSAGLLSAAAILYLLVGAAALYPGWLAARVPPVAALHHE